MYAVTREHKLALIVGFSLILLVGVLVSDHVSSSKRPSINQVAQSESVVTKQNMPKGVDPRAVLALPGESALAQAPAPRDVGFGTSASADPLAGLTAPPVVPVTISQTKPSTVDRLLDASKDVGKDALDEVVRLAGGSIDRSSDGRSVIRLPGPVPAAGTSRTADAAKPARTPTSQAAVADKAERLAPVRQSDVLAVEAMKFHTVVEDDTLFEIAKKYYGTGHIWQRLAEANNLKGGQVRLGQKLRIPSRESLMGTAQAAPKIADPTARLAEAATTRVDEGRKDAKPARQAPQAAPQRSPQRQNAAPAQRPRTELATYTVRRGDTLKEIAQRTLGSTSRWRELADLNKIEDADDLQAGKILRLPRRG